ncbi:UDP-galactose transporter senju-like [Asterias amurensis]|uniref:UDP-galactose transporter senju-like n=1 Tax=Asterias amurensis TaxID=7602 RepID=UPI003AB62BBC
MLGLEGFVSWFVFAAYITLFVNNNLLVTASKNKDNQYSYSTILVVILIEFSKLIISILLCLRSQSVTALFQDFTSNRKAFLYYMIPAGLYCICNNLVFFNLGRYDMTTYTVLMQFGIVTTGLTYQCIFQRQLSCVQWMSLVILTFGCIMAHLNSVDQQEIIVNSSILFVLIQLLCSSFAGVYSEFLLKNFSIGLSFWQQNIAMYTDSCIFGVVSLAFTRTLNNDLFSPQSIRSLSRPLVIALICNNVAAGLVTSLFLTKLNSILKKFAVAIEMIILALIGHLFMGQTVNLTMAAAVFLVSFAIVLYSLYPLKKIEPQIELTELKVNGNH